MSYELKKSCIFRGPVDKHSLPPKIWKIFKSVMEPRVVGFCIRFGKLMRIFATRVFGFIRGF